MPAVRERQGPPASYCAATASICFSSASTSAFPLSPIVGDVVLAHLRKRGLLQLGALLRGQLDQLVAVLLERLERLLLLLARLLEGDLPALVQRLADGGLTAGRLLVEPRLVDEQNLVELPVIGQRDVGLHLVELHVPVDGDRVLLGVDRAGLQGGVGLGERHRHRLHAERLVLLDEDRRRHDARGQPVIGGRRVEGNVGGPRLEARVPDVQQLHVVRLDALPQRIQRVAVVDRDQLLGVARPEERKVEDPEERIGADDIGGGQEAHLDGAELDALVDVVEGAELAAREDLDVDVAPVVRLDDLLHLVRPEVARIARRQEVTDLHDGLGVCRVDRRCDDEAGPGQQCRQECAVHFPSQVQTSGVSRSISAYNPARFKRDGTQFTDLQTRAPVAKGTGNAAGASLADVRAAGGRSSGRMTEMLISRALKCPSFSIPGAR